MNTRKELEKALAPLNIKVFNYADFEQLDLNYGSCKHCGWEGALQVSNLCETCEEQEIEARSFGYEE